MSAICGLIDFDGAPVSPADLDLMTEALDFTGREKARTIVQGQTGFAFVPVPNTPEDAFENQPRTLPDGRVILTWARLYNREDLIPKLGISPAEATRTADGDILIKAFERWGRDFVHHLVGQFSAAIWDPNRRELFLAIDHMGETAIYFSRQGRRFVFATHLQSLFALPCINREINDEVFAHFLARRHQEDHHRTIYRGVERLPAGTTLLVDPDRTRREDYWDLESLPRLKFRSPEDMFEAFAEIMEKATRARLRTTREVGLFLSGGLDSGAAAAFAAPLLKAENRPLLTYTLRPLPGPVTELPPGRIADETPFVQALAQRHPNLQPAFSDESLPHFLTDLAEVFQAWQMPPITSSQTQWLFHGLKNMAARGAGVVLYAQRGNFTVSWWGAAPLAEMLVRGQWKQLARHIQGLRRNRDLTYWKIFRRTGGQILYSGLINWFRDQRGRPRVEDGEKLLPFLNPDWSKKLELEQSFRVPEKGCHRRYHLNGRAFRVNVHQTAAYRKYGNLLQCLAAPMGLEVSDVTADRRLMEFSLGLEDADFQYQGWDRALARFGCGDRLPDLIGQRTDRGLQPVDALRYSWRNSDLVDEALSNLKRIPAVQERINLPALDSFWRELLSHRSGEERLHLSGGSEKLDRVIMFQALLTAGIFFDWLGRRRRQG